MKVKVLTVKQPWAYLICSGIKDIENRTWKTNFRGRIYIHSSAKGIEFSNPNEVFTKEQYSSLDNEHKIMVIMSKKAMECSSIIGSVEIVDCVQNHPSLWAENGVWNWVLANPILFPEPIPAKGKLSFWEYDKISEPVSDGGHKICMCRICVDEKVQVMSMGNYFVCKYITKWN